MKHKKQASSANATSRQVFYGEKKILEDTPKVGGTGTVLTVDNADPCTESKNPSKTP